MKGKMSANDVRVHADDEMCAFEGGWNAVENIPVEVAVGDIVSPQGRATDLRQEKK